MVNFRVISKKHCEAEQTINLRKITKQIHKLALSYELSVEQ